MCKIVFEDVDKKMKLICQCYSVINYCDVQNQSSTLEKYDIYTTYISGDKTRYSARLAFSNSTQDQLNVLAKWAKGIMQCAQYFADRLSYSVFDVKI